MNNKYQQSISQLVNLSEQECEMVARYAQQNGLGTGGFSAALRGMLQEWAVWQRSLDELSSEQQERVRSRLAAVRVQVTKEDRRLEEERGAAFPAMTRRAEEEGQGEAPAEAKDDYTRALFWLRVGKYQKDGGRETGDRGGGRD